MSTVGSVRSWYSIQIVTLIKIGMILIDGDNGNSDLTVIHNVTSYRYFSHVHYHRHGLY